MIDLIAISAAGVIILVIIGCALWLANLNGKYKAIQEREDADKAAMAELDAKILAVRESVRADSDTTIRDRLRRNAVKD